MMRCGSPLARLALLLLLLLSPAWAQHYSFKYYGQEQGLSNLGTECLFQDHTGYLWVGTQNGLFRYDGAVFTRFGEAEGLPSASVEAVAETPDGILWVATQAGLAWRKGMRFEEVDLGKRSEHRSHFGLASDNTGKLYVSTPSGLLLSDGAASGASRKFKLVPGQPPGPVYGLHVNQDGAIWYGCGFAVCRLDGTTTTVFGTSEGVPADRWDALLTDREGTVWIRSSKHLLKKERSAHRFEPTSQLIPTISDFASLRAGRDGELFVPTDDGLWELSDGHWREISLTQGLISNAVSAVLQDREGSLWIGLWGAGVARWVGRNQWEAWTHSEGISGEHIWMMTRDQQGDFWVTTDKGVNQWRGSARGPERSVWKAWTEKEGIAGTKTRAIALAPDGDVWIGSSPGGITRINPVTRAVHRYWLPKAPGSDRIWNLAFDHTGTLWASTRGGLFFARPHPNKGQITFEKQELPLGDAGEMIFAVLEDTRKRLWVGGTKGLARRENGIWKRFTVQDGLPTNSVGFFAEAPDGTLWVGYRDRSGLSKIDARGDRLSMQTYNHESGLRSNQAIFVRVDRRGWLWFGTDHGVDVFRQGKWQHYGQQDGMIWDDCDGESFYEDADGSVWIGTSRGLAHFRVPAAPPVSKGPQVEFTRFELGNQVLNPKRYSRESYHNRSLLARISVLTFLGEDDVVCRYRLLGLDPDWVETKQREIRFPDLPQGQYVLEATARDTTGKWSPKPARIVFEILPPWWATWWFHLALLASGLLLVIEVIHWRTRRLQEEQARLETAVEERTRQLRAEQERIEQQNYEIEKLLKEARQANRFKDEFLANMSHEIRTPMHGILGMVHSVMTSELKPNQKDALQTVHSCAQSLLCILNDILDFSKVEAGKLEIVPAPFRVADTLQGACSTFVATARAKGVLLSWNVENNVPEWLECDASRIRQVLLNLVGNAVKFTSHGEIRVAVSAVDVGNEILDLRFSVTDTGIGIPEKSRGLIFEAFRQADGSTSRTYGGTGLGLAISSRLVQLMGGEITVESQVGVGSKFTFWVKARRTDAPAAEQASPVAAASRTSPSRPLHILLAEDNLVNQKVATALLTKRGHRLQIVGDGRLAVERSKSETFDLILMDLQMPEMDGWEATKQIRERDSRRGVYVPIIALTAHAMSHAQAQCLAAGMDAVIVKPFDPAQFYSVLEATAANREKTVDKETVFH